MLSELKNDGLEGAHQVGRGLSGHAMVWMIAKGIAGSDEDVRARRGGVRAKDVQAGVAGTFGEIRRGEDMEVTRRIQRAPIMPEPPVSQARGVRGGHNEPASRLEYPSACRKEVQRSRHVLDYVVEGDRVERVGRKIGVNQIAVMKLQPV